MESKGRQTKEGFEPLNLEGFDKKEYAPGNEPQHDIKSTPKYQGMIAKGIERGKNS
jgi:hypothetical protein